MKDHAVTHDGLLLPALSSHRWNPLIDRSNVCRATIALPIPIRIPNHLTQSYIIIVDIAHHIESAVHA
jgi:hypothetical protein